uniref:site-2 protease family protein n=1 Tax=Microbulbifer agarilyticus TaxID=260552 RepID=UPI001303664A|nr:site-2 protease family protein [Microbulbifer agarilyticus]
MSHAATTLPLASPSAPSNDSAWRPLRSDLQFHRMEEDPLTQVWLLYDPLRGQYLELGELELLTLQQWNLGSAEAIASTLSQQQGCRISPQQIESIFRFASDNELLQNSSDALAQKRAQITPMQQGLGRLQKTLFFRRALFVPTLSSRLLRPLARATALPGFYLLLTVTALFCAISVGQHSTEFLAYFSASWNPLGGLAFFICYLLLSLFHEIGHASVARLYGIRANSVGVGLIALMPIMYSDITDAWRLPRKARLHISAAGVAFELCLGVAAALIWCLVNDGVIRTLMFYLFTTSLVTTLLINANPLMKFDGYYLLSDFLRERNLQQTATNTLRQWCWALLLRDTQRPTGYRHKLLGAFGLAGLIYRLLIFAAISYAAYQLLFKAAGILVFFLCIGLLVVLPAVREIQGFWSHLQRQRQIQSTQPKKTGAAKGRHMKSSAAQQESHTPTRSNTRLLPMFRSASLWCIATLLILALAPLPWPIQLPASTYFESQQTLMAPANAKLRTLLVARGEFVRAGQPIAELADDELEYRIQRTRAELALLQQRQQADRFAENLDVLEGVYLQDLLSKQQLLRQLHTHKQQLQVLAKVDGNVDWTLPGLHVGQFLTLNQAFLSIAARDTLAGRAYASTQQFSRLSESTNAQRRGRLFLDGQWRPVTVQLRNIEDIASHALVDPALASNFGGPVQTLADDRERAADALHLISFEFPPAAAHANASRPTTAQRTGHLVLFGEPVSLAYMLVQRIAGVFIRESGM